MKYIQYILAVVILLVILLAVGSSENAPNSTSLGQTATSSGELVAQDSKFDFGKLEMSKGKVEHEFKLTNQSDEAVKIIKVYTSCMCTTAEILDESGKEIGVFGMPGHGLSKKISFAVASQEEVRVKAIFDPSAHGPSGVGLAERSIFIITNSKTQPKIEFKIKALVVR